MRRVTCWSTITCRSWNRLNEDLEARVGFEPTNGGFADLSLGPLGYRAKRVSIAKILPAPGSRSVEGARAWRYFFVSTAGATILASRRKRADSSGGVGLM